MWIIIRYKYINPCFNHVTSPDQPNLKECQVTFKDADAAKTALYLTGMDLGDRKLMISTTRAIVSYV
jgi:hypothetical protein